MKSFYKQWLEKSDQENLEALQNEATLDPQPSTSTQARVTGVTTRQKASTSQASTSQLNPSRQQPNPTTDTPEMSNTQTDIVYENNKLLLLVERGTFQRQKRFRLQDHLFHLKIKVKNKNEGLPFLKDIFDFLERGLLHVMENIKSFYNTKDENLAFLTLFQQPMVTGLNSGIYL